MLAAGLDCGFAVVVGLKAGVVDSALAVSGSDVVAGSTDTLKCIAAITNTVSPSREAIVMAGYTDDLAFIVL